MTSNASKKWSNLFKLSSKRMIYNVLIQDGAMGLARAAADPEKAARSAYDAAKRR